MQLPSDIDVVCEKATRIWGHQAQEAMLVGEIGELLTMFGRRAQRRDTQEQWIDEIADVTMMIHQLAIMHGKEAVEARIAVKLEKLKLRLKKYECPECAGCGVHMDWGVVMDECKTCHGTGRNPGV
ncbi:MAG: hypothetical protein WC869_01255 [Phycisphaerae bacterium]|jgi:NTP pyrophosphatase (non-canonical NTP hydrolase)